MNRGFYSFCQNLHALSLTLPLPRHKLYFLQKTQMLQKMFFISVTLRWHSGVKNHEIWTFKVNFSLKDIKLGPHLKKIIFDNFKIEQLLFLK